MRSEANLRRLATIAAVGVGATIACGSTARAGYVQTNLVSDIPGLAALTDTALKNPWGVSESATSPFWISDQGMGESTLYTVKGTTLQSEATLSVTTASPTGQVHNSTTGFVVSGTAKPAAFIFANLNGTITAWNTSLGTGPGTPTTVEATTSGASYTGLAIDPGTQQIYAANDTGAGSIDVFNSSFQRVSLGAGAFVDPNLPAGLVPFNVQEIKGQLYVTYAPSGHGAQTSAAAGSGAVAIFSTSGTFIKQVVSGSNLASPWGITLAPANFGEFHGDLLVGNFSFADSGINAFNPATGALEGTILIDVGTGHTSGGLWDLTFGNGGSGGSTNDLYFTDGINSETAGLFGVISVPEPSSLLLLGPALVFVAGLSWRVRRGRQQHV
jgi:uncharacterized protein (TIGR03118 family)